MERARRVLPRSTTSTCHQHSRNGFPTNEERVVRRFVLDSRVCDFYVYIEARRQSFQQSDDKWRKPRTVRVIVERKRVRGLVRHAERRRLQIRVREFYARVQRV